MTLPDPRYTKDQLLFLQERTKQELVKWCSQLVLGGDPRRAKLKLDPNCPYVRFAVNRKPHWLSESGGEYKVVGAGWKAATSSLKS